MHILCSGNLVTREKYSPWWPALQRRKQFRDLKDFQVLEEWHLFCIMDAKCFLCKILFHPCYLEWVNISLTIFSLLCVEFDMVIFTCNPIKVSTSNFQLPGHWLYFYVPYCICSLYYYFEFFQVRLMLCWFIENPFWQAEIQLNLQKRRGHGVLSVLRPKFSGLLGEALDVAARWSGDVVST